MSKILLINPNKWGRGVTHIWIASHSSILKKQGHEVSLFDCTFYQDWSENEVAFNEKNNMYKKSDYERSIVFNKNSVYEDLQKKIDSLNFFNFESFYGFFISFATYSEFIRLMIIMSPIVIINVFIFAYLIIKNMKFFSNIK